jgi:hypothetical protein
MVLAKDREVGLSAMLNKKKSVTEGAVEGREVAEHRVEQHPGRGRTPRDPERAWEVRRSRMARRLDRIEKEMGYCEVKLEKERRLRKQIDFLKADVDILDRQVEKYSTWALNHPHGLGQEGFRRPSRQGFLSAGLLEILQEEREILNRELEEITARLLSFSGFETKRRGLEEEKRSTLKDLSPAHSSKIRRINDDFNKIERQWNTVSEDLINLDEAIFFLDRNLDYLRSCRTFLIAAKGNFDIENWRSSGYISDLFRHSHIGRAKEMADGADRNLKLAQKELVCVFNVKLKAEPFQRVLQAFLEALYEDIFVEGKLENSLQVVEAALAGNIKLVEQVKAKREVWGAKLEELEKHRTLLFSRLDSGRREWLVG